MAYIWTPISNAFEAYRRRFIVDPNAVYEHTWRLIHIHESLIVTLGAAFATRLFHFWTNEPGRIKDEDLKKLQIQQMITGLNKESSCKDDPKGCLSGSIFEWISLLNSAIKLDLEPPCPFITALQDYLGKTPDKQEKSQLAFLPEWERIAPPVPPNHKENGLSRIWRFQAINELRNKLAHVPISGRIIPHLHEGLRKELLLLLTDKPKWINTESTADLPIQDWHNPLCGRIVNKYAYVEGSTFGKAFNNNDSTEVYWEWNPEPNAKKQKQNDPLPPIQWKASPFVHFDDELKVSILFRLPNLNYDLDVNLTGEYYRFAAEVEPVQKRDVSVEAIQPWLPVKVPSDVAEAIDSSYINDASTNPVEVINEQLVPLEELKAEELRKKAEDAFKASDYNNAVMYYDEMAKRKLPNYTDVAKSRHGAALWRVANISKADIEERKAQFERSIQLLAEASQHREIGYKAESHYQKSKALWHLSEIDAENKERLIEQSIEEVEIAIGLSLEQRYIGWYEWLREKIETSDDETDTSDNETGKTNDETGNSENQ